MVSRESIDTCTAKVASLETSVWHFGRTVGLLSVVRDNEDNKDFRDVLSGYYFKYGKKVWKADDSPSLTFWDAGMRAGGVVEYHGRKPAGELQRRESKGVDVESCCFGILAKICPKREKDGAEG
eukprot:g18828.t1